MADVLMPVSPIDGQPLAAVAVTSAAAVHDACRQVKDDWMVNRGGLRRTGPAVARRVAALLRQRAEEGADLVTREMGKRRHGESDVEIAKAADFFEWAAERMERDGRRELVAEDRQVAVIERRAVGLVGIVTPWNFPVSIPAEYLAGAVAAGAGIVWKPSEQVPESSRWLLDVLLDGGVPPRSVAMITGPGRPTGEALFASPHLDCLCFTGSSAVGARVASLVGLRGRILELGGNCAVIVTRTADIDHAAKEIVWGGTSNAGQRCNAVERVIVTVAEADALTAAIEREVTGLGVGDPRDPSSDLGPVVTIEAAERIRRTVAAAVDGGAEVTATGRDPGSGDPYVPAMVLTGVRRDMQVFADEVFGPVIPILVADDVDDALAAANASGYGLYGAVFTDAADVVERCQEELDVSLLLHNQAPGRWNAVLPVGGAAGTKSGVGRVGGAYALDEITELRCTQW